MLTIGITGGIATGKSLVTDFIKSKGFPVISADNVAHDIVEPNHSSHTLDKIVSIFGEDVLIEGNLNRKKLGEIVFNNPDKLAKLNALMQPVISQELQKQVDKYKDEETKVLFLEIPLLFERGYENKVDQVWTIFTDPKRQIDNLMTRNLLSQDQAEARIKSQMPLSEKIKKSDKVINNVSSIDDTRRQVLELLDKL